MDELRKRYNEEVERTLALENQAEDFAVACKIRALINAVETKENIVDEILNRIFGQRLRPIGTTRLLLPKMNFSENETMLMVQNERNSKGNIIGGDCL